MKWFSKINRGAILTAIVIFGVVVYLVGLSISQKSNIPEIKKICSEYIENHVKYSMLPEGQRKKTPDITEKELSNFVKEMESDISKYYPKGEQYSKLALNELNVSLQHQAGGQNVVLAYEKEILDFSKFVFKEDTVTVTILTDSSIERTDRNELGDTQDKVRSETVDKIILIKTDGEWKIINADISSPGNKNQEYNPDFYKY